MRSSGCLQIVDAFDTILAPATENTHGFRELCLDKSRCNGIDANVLRGTRFCHYFTEAEQSRLADGIRTHQLQTRAETSLTAVVDQTDKRLSRYAGPARCPVYILRES